MKNKKLQHEMLSVQENQILNIKLNFEKDREKLENLYVEKPEEEIFKKELTVILEAISLELTNIQSTIEELETTKKLDDFINVVLEKHKKIKRLSLKLENIAISFKAHKIAKLIIENFYTNSVIIVFLLCSKSIDEIYKYHKKIPKEILIELFYEYSRILESTKKEIYKSSEEYLYKNLSLFVSVVLQINQEASLLEKEIDKKSKGFGQNKLSNSQKQKIKKVQETLISILFFITNKIKKEYQNVELKIINIDWQIYTNFTKSLGETSWCIPIYSKDTIKLIFKNKEIANKRIPGIGKNDFVIPKSFYDPLPSDILNAFEGKN